MHFFLIFFMYFSAPLPLRYLYLLCLIVFGKDNKYEGVYYSCFSVHKM